MRRERRVAGIFFRVALYVSCRTPPTFIITLLSASVDILVELSPPSSLKEIVENCTRFFSSMKIVISKHLLAVMLRSWFLPHWSGKRLTPHSTHTWLKMRKDKKTYCKTHSLFQFKKRFALIHPNTLIESHSMHDVVSEWQACNVLNINSSNEISSHQYYWLYLISCYQWFTIKVPVFPGE